MSDWISVQDRLPEDGRVVLAVKQLRRSGRGHHSRGGRSYCLAYCIRNYRHYDPDTRQTVVAPYWVCRGTNNNVICWMPVPEMPKEVCGDAAD